MLLLEILVNGDEVGQGKNDFFKNRKPYMGFLLNKENTELMVYAFGF